LLIKKEIIENITVSLTRNQNNYCNLRKIYEFGFFTTIFMAAKSSSSTEAEYCLLSMERFLATFISIRCHG